MVCLRQSQKETLVFDQQTTPGSSIAFWPLRDLTAGSCLWPLQLPPPEGTKIQDMWVKVLTLAFWSRNWAEWFCSLHHLWPGLSSASRCGWTSEWVPGHHLCVSYFIPPLFLFSWWVETRLMMRVGNCGGEKLLDVRNPGSSNWHLSFLLWRPSSFLLSCSRPTGGYRLPWLNPGLGGGNPWFLNQLCFFLVVWHLGGAHGFTDPRTRGHTPVSHTDEETELQGG